VSVNAIISGAECISTPSTYHNDIRSIAMTTSILTQKHLKEIMHYNPDTGSFTWLVKIGSGGKGKEAGHARDNGYRRCCIYGRNYYMHRLAFIYMEGSMPAAVDHINCVRDDNRWSNIRASSSLHNNSRIRASARDLPHGVHRNRTGGKYNARIEHKGKTIVLGSYVTPEEASVVYEAKRAELIAKNHKEVDRVKSYRYHKHGP